jgi:hypothetical protein
MRDGIWNRSGTRRRILWSGAVLLIIGLSVILLAGEWFAAFDACLANPACAPPGSTSTLEGYLAVMVAGLALSVVGAMVALLEFRKPHLIAPL